MIQDNLYTPIKRTKKTLHDQSNKDDYDINLRTSINSNKKNIIMSSIIPLDKIKSNPSFSLDKNNKKSF